jgi:acetyltransferase
VDWSRHQGLGFAQIVSLGNQADVNETDMLPIVAHDPHARVIALYMEGVADGARFVEIARGVSLEKPIVAMKVGRSESGQRAAASHTGAMAASDDAFAAAFAKCGVFRATSAEEMFDWARALEHYPLPTGRRVAVLTNAGGPGVIAADALDTHALKLATLAPPTRARLSAALPSAASVGNPVDMLASASPAQYAYCLATLLEDTGVDAVLVILPPPPTFTAESVAADLIPLIRAASKPVLVALLGSELTKSAFELFNQSGVPTYPFPERAASALAALFRRARFLDAARRAAPPSRPVDKKIDTDGAPERLLAAYGIRTAPLRLATSPEEAAAIATELGFPVAMKIASASIAHKSDVGGVLLGIRSAQQASSGYTKLVKEVRALVPDAVLEGVTLQPEVQGGQEVILGAVRDPHFGPLIMFGSGGVEAEALKDVAFALAPLTELEADNLIQRTWAGRRLDGFRNIPSVDKAAVQDAVIRLSWLAHEHREISEIEINPLRVLERGAIALDIRLQI